MSKRQSVLLDQLRESMPEDVKYVTVERCPNTGALNVFFLVGEKWHVARGLDYESLWLDASILWDDHFDKIDMDTDDEPPKRWAAANEVAQNLLTHFKLGGEFCDHVGWSMEPACKLLSLQEQEELSGKILEFLKPLLMLEADAPFPRRLPLPTVACSECGAGVEVLRVESDTKGCITIDGHVQHFPGYSVVRCYKCSPTIGPIKCDGESVELSDVIAAKTEELEAQLKPGVTRIEFDEPEPLRESTTNSVARGKPITMDDCLEGAAKGCTCGAWVTKETHADHCALAE